MQRKETHDALAATACKRLAPLALILRPSVALADLLNLITDIQAYAAQLGVSSCVCSDDNSSCPYLINNDIINGGQNDKGQVDLPTNRVRRCQSAQADTAFIWFAFACFVGTFYLSFMAWRRGGKV